MWISRYFVLFIIFSICGWIYETLYCSIKDGYWQNRGFLFGPLCPIYGCGAASVTAIAEKVSSSVNAPISWWQIFLVGVVGSIFLEYGTSWTLEKLFHAVWWDYSDMPLNVHGRICAPASFLFGVMAVFIYYVVFPWTLEIKAAIPPIVMEALSLFLMGIFAMDATLTVSALTNFASTVKTMTETANQNMEMFAKAIGEKAQAASETLQAAGGKITGTAQVAGEKITGTAQAAGGVISGKAQLAGEALGELKAKLTADHAKRAAINMAHLHRSAINRVSGFRYPKPSIPYADRLRDEISKRSIRIGIFSFGKKKDGNEASDEKTEE